MALEIGAEWPDRVDLRIWIKNEGDGVYGALVEQFNIAGQGRSAELAQRNAVELTIDYLNTYMVEGAAFADAMRPIPSWLKLKLHGETLMSKIPAIPFPSVELVHDAERLRPVHC